jgi:hypothetical protein
MRVAVLKTKLRFQELFRSKEARPSIEKCALIRRSLARLENNGFVL